MYKNRGEAGFFSKGYNFQFWKITLKIETKGTKNAFSKLHH